MYYFDWSILYVIDIP